MSKTKEERAEAFDAERDLEAERQNLPPGSQPERRPQGTIAPAPVKGKVFQKLKDADSPLTNDQERMPAEAFELAQKRAEDSKYKDEEAPEAEFYPGAHCVIDNPTGKGKEHHGRAVAVNLALNRDPANNNLPREYECTSRDGRAERLYVKHEHLRPVAAGDFQRTET